MEVFSVKLIKDELMVCMSMVKVDRLTQIESEEIVKACHVLEINYVKVGINANNQPTLSKLR